MQTIIEALEEKIPHGNWCNQGGRDKWCPYFKIHKPHLADNGSIQSYYCEMMEEYVVRKQCGINEQPHYRRNEP